MKKFFEDFKKFIGRGNVLDLAIGMIIGAAFNKIVSSMVNDLLMPLISLVFKGDITNMFWILKGSANWVANDAGVLELVKSADAVLLFWGRFLQSIIDFLIIGFTLFVIVKVSVGVQKRAEIRREQLKEKLSKGEEVSEEEVAEVETAEPEVSEEVLLLREIRDALAQPE